MDKLMYLKPNVVFEPLVDRWYAWSHLISPATAAMNIVNRHLKIMSSYVSAPAIHASSVKNPKMRGGPFIDLNGERVDEVKQLINDTMQSRSHMIELAKSITDLEKILKEKGTGYSLEALYPDVPENLKGLVELVYDLNNNPTYRFYESLLYRSEFYNKSSQSIVFWLTANDERPFVLSTPRLDNENVCHVPLAFDNGIIDDLARMKKTKGNAAEMMRRLNLDDKQQQLFSTFFTEEEPVRYQKYTGDKIRMRYFGHACILIETATVSILVDPLISYYGFMSDIDKFSDVDLPDEIDYVLITHNHQDHILLETLLPLRHKIKNIVVPDGGNRSIQDPRLKIMFEAIGFKSVLEISEFEQIIGKDCTITGVPFLGEHCDLDIMSKMCYHIHFGKFSVLFVADSCISEPMFYHRIHEFTGDIDVICFGMECEGAALSWLYGPLLTYTLARDKDHSRRLAGSNFAKGKGFVDVFHPKEIYVYAMGMEPWVEFISSIKYTEESGPIVESNKMLSYCREKNVIAERLFGEKELLYTK
ncbi:MBL fold metallo-hydrolase [Chitinophaga sp. GbtcB8]|uniref:MBL fold metallo-hydrolase n=1 Tax=Chitinophaga sp. GbtcB8 TaxID=2824753 RepID=UPI001C30E5B8|nr:MBL fold metallo-hydrolase [Chitinophaga sp. GbtcB8]